MSQEQTRTELLKGRRRLIHHVGLPPPVPAHDFGSIYASKDDHFLTDGGEHYLFSVHPAPGKEQLARAIENAYLYPDGASTPFWEGNHMLSYPEGTATPLLAKLEDPLHLERARELLERLLQRLDAEHLRLARVINVPRNGDPLGLETLLVVSSAP